LSDIPSHRELYEGKKGSFFKIKNIKQLSKLLNQTSSCFEIQKELSLELIKQNFSAKIMSKKYQEIYKEKLVGAI